MPLFRYKTVSKNRKLQSGSISAFSKSQARKKLEKDGNSVVLIIPEDAGVNKQITLPSLGFSKPEQILFFRNVSAMARSGISIAESLRVVREQTNHSLLKKSLRVLVEDVENGKSLSSSMQKFPRLFSPFLCALVNVGEVSGRLVDTLDEISVDLEREHELQREIFSQLAYPLVVIVVMIAVLVAMVLYILPKIAELFAELSIPLPVVTRVLFEVGMVVKSNFLLVLLGIVMVPVIFSLLLRNPKARFIIHLISLKIPIFGQIMRESTLVKFFRSLEAMLRSQLSLIRSVEVAQSTIKNEVYRRALESIHPTLLHGVPFSEALKTAPHLFPLQVQRMIEVGERSGSTSESLQHISSHYQRTLRYKLRTMTTLIEPAMILFVGIVMGIIALSIFLPIYNSTSFNI